MVGRVGGHGVDTEAMSAEWHALRVEVAGSRLPVWLDGQSLFEVEDATFADAGKVGLWSKADSVTLFDDFRHSTN